MDLGFSQRSSGEKEIVYNGSRSSSSLQKPYRFTTTGRLRDGCTPDTPLLSSHLQNNPDKEFRYLANHMGQWVEIDATDGRLYESLHVPVYLFEPRPLVPAEFVNPFPPPHTEQAFRKQMQQADYNTDLMDDYLNPATPIKVFDAGSDKDTPSPCPN